MTRSNEGTLIILGTEIVIITALSNDGSVHAITIVAGVLGAAVLVVTIFGRHSTTNTIYTDIGVAEIRY